MSTPEQWRDLIAAAGLPLTTDTQGVCAIFEAIEGKKPAVDTVRRWSIPYKLRGQKRDYQVQHAIDHAVARFRNAPVRVAAVARQKRPLRRVAPSDAASNAAAENRRKIIEPAR